MRMNLQDRMLIFQHVKMHSAALHAMNFLDGGAGGLPFSSARAAGGTPYTRTLFTAKGVCASAGA
ncbi:hypothetical protein PGRAT_08895 [Paenibacillus graminis]|uniref:Uncharacterized protein n=1 Tax=Paenibacillus graminis TaxID=189425 RepID=A0A089M3E5_9BACL|nr:hypothetical protein PGRAT_08895 [Paenibacillus graminis]